MILSIKEASELALKERSQTLNKRPLPHADLRKGVLFDRAATKRPRNQALHFFTHPIFESDFDCLTGKNRLHANSLLSLSPLTNKKLL